MNARDRSLIAEVEYMGGVESIRSFRRPGWRRGLGRGQRLLLQLGSAR